MSYSYIMLCTLRIPHLNIEQLWSSLFSVKSFFIVFRFCLFFVVGFIGGGGGEGGREREGETEGSDLGIFSFYQKFIFFIMDVGVSRNNPRNVAVGQSSTSCFSQVI